NIRRSESDRRHIVETTLWEISPVTWGANPMTPLLELKSGEDLAAVHKRMLAQVHQAQAALKTGISDELGLRLESMLELWEAQLQALAKGQAEPDPAAGVEKA